MYLQTSLHANRSFSSAVGLNLPDVDYLAIAGQLLPLGADQLFVIITAVNQNVHVTVLLSGPISIATLSSGELRFKHRSVELRPTVVELTDVGHNVTAVAWSTVSIFRLYPTCCRLKGVAIKYSFSDLFRRQPSHIDGTAYGCYKMLSHRRDGRCRTS
jgi:hypothetical protein